MKPTTDVLILRVSGDTVEEVTDEVASETPCRLYVNGTPVLTFLCSPFDCDALAVGFAYTEGWVRNLDALGALTLEDSPWAVRLEIASLPNDWMQRLEERTLTSGCGAGLTFARTDAGHEINNEKSRNLRPNIAEIRFLMKELREKAGLYQRTGGTHVAALTTGDRLLIWAEDIGRHNAVDKVIGRAFLEGETLQDKILIFSGRVSTEIMWKSAQAGIPIVVSRAAPTCMSVSVAETRGVTLIGFARGDRMNVYSHPWRLRL